MSLAITGTKAYIYVGMESFEHICKVALEAEGFVVTTNVKFPGRRQTRRADRDEFQTHGYEVDLVGARMDALVLASVKSFLGSRGVNADAFVGLVSNPTPRDVGGYKLFNDSQLRNSVKAVAAERYGYELDQIKLRLYVRKFAGVHDCESAQGRTSSRLRRSCSERGKPHSRQRARRAGS